MKILILTTHLNVGGISSYVLNLSKGLKQESIDVNIASGGGDVLANFCALGIPHYSIDIDTKSELSPKIIKSAFILNKLINKEKFDLIHSQTRVTQVLAALLNKITGIPYVSTCHGFYKFRLGRKLFPCFGKFVIAVSRQVKDELKDNLYVKAEKIKLITHGVDTDKFLKNFTLEEKKELRRSLGLKDDSFVIGSIGRLAQEKGHKFLIMALSQVVKKHPACQLILIGEGRLKEELLLLVKDLNLGNKVHFFGQRLDLEKIYPAMDIFCFPSLRESFGFSVLEALGFGIPVIASNIGELKYLIEDSKNGFLSRPADPESLASKINYLIENPNLLNEMQRQARKIISENFSISRMAKDTIAVYKECIKSE